MNAFRVNTRKFINIAEIHSKMCKIQDNCSETKVMLEIALKTFNILLVVS